MAPKKKARTGQGANATTGVAVDPLLDDAGEHPRSENIPPATILPDSTTTDQTALVLTPTEGATVPLTDIPVSPLVPASDSGISDVDIRGAIQMLAQIVASQTQRSNVAPTSCSQRWHIIGSNYGRILVKKEALRRGGVSLPMPSLIIYCLLRLRQPVLLSLRT